MNNTLQIPPYRCVWLGVDGSTYEVTAATKLGVVEQFCIVTTEYTVPKPQPGSGVYIVNNYNQWLAGWVA